MNRELFSTLAKVPTSWADLSPETPSVVSLELSDEFDRRQGWFWRRCRIIMEDFMDNREGTIT